MIYSSSLKAMTDVLSNFNFWSILIAASFIIFIGFIFQRKKLIFSDWEKVVVKIILYAALPALALKSFLIDINTEDIWESIFIAVIGIIFYTSLTFGSKYFFIGKTKALQDALGMSIAFSSAVYFGVMIVKAISPDQQKTIDLYSSLFLIGFWIFMYSAADNIMKKKRFNKNEIENSLLNKKEPKSFLSFIKVFKNPVIIATFVGIFLWLFQLIPGVKIIHINDEYYSISRIDKFIPGLSQILNILAPLASPLAWFSMGAVLAKSQIKEALKSSLVWWTTFIKNVITPIICVILFLIFSLILKGITGNWISSLAFVLCVAIIASPTANTIVGYAIIYNKEPKIASHVGTLTILTSIITIPLWILVASAIGATQLFS
ncbi:AEC family transporter [Mesoplasma tabanidae]|uniref:Malate permease n=1 Tax=Mesoplasma tabanidae TaxID=219745 RepID=A0A2K8P4E7_9MOLU|nr:AEC family transporter [Mesoplasma tabanidae]ATZ21621.1 malate permease [Mesoplasma tabanidae]